MKYILYVLILPMLIIMVFSTLQAQPWNAEFQKHNGKTFREINTAMEAYFDIIGRDKDSKYKHYQRWADIAYNHTDEKGKLFNHTAKNLKLHKRMKKSMQSNDSRHFHGYWEDVNPNNFVVPGGGEPVMGRVNCMVKSPSNSQIIYLGAATGGLWKSFNNGNTWYPLMDGMVQLGVSSIVIDYTNENHVLILTGDADFGHMPSNGVFESWDAGITWREVYSFPLKDLVYGYKMVQDKLNPQEYYLALRGPSSIIGLKKLNINTGTLINQYNTFRVFDIEYKPGSSEVIYAMTPEGPLRRQTPSSVWEVLANNASSGLPVGYFPRTQLAVSPHNPEVVYCLYVKYPPTGTSEKHYYSLYKSVDGGDSFSLKVDSSYQENMLGDQTYMDLVLEVDPNNSAHVFIGGAYLFESFDSGNTFPNQFEPADDLHADQHNAYIYNDTLYACTDGGLSRKSMSESTFTSLNNGLLITQFYNIDVQGDRFIGGTQDNGTMLWEHGDLNGTRVIGADGFDCLFDKNNSNIVYSSTQESRFKSQDGGTSFPEELHPNKYKGPIKHWVDDPDKVISAEDVFHVSLDNGANWQSPVNPFAPVTHRIISFSQCAANDDVMYVASFSPRDTVLKSTNFSNLSSAAWTDITAGLPKPIDIREILVHPDSSNVVWLSRAGYKTIQIYKSIDGGDTWENYSQGISKLPVYCMAYDYVNGNGIYIGTELGIYYRQTGMSEWIPFSTYLPQVPVQEIVVTDLYVYAGTFGRGLWRSEKYRTCDYNLFLTQTNDPTNNTPSGHQVHKASNVITSTRKVFGGSGTDVIYQAGNYVELQEGFYATSSGDEQLVVKNAGCTE